MKQCSNDDAPGFSFGSTLARLPNRSYWDAVWDVAWTRRLKILEDGLPDAQAGTASNKKSGAAKNQKQIREHQNAVQAVSFQAYMHVFAFCICGSACQG